jgi:ABC-2 type transport system permease protein
VEVARRVLLELSRNRRLVFFWAWFPASMLILFGWVYAGSRGGIGPSFSWTAPGILIGAAMFFSCVGGPAAILVGERERKTLRRLQLTPLSGASYFLGVTLAHLVVAGAQAGVTYGITYAVGGSFSGPLGLGLVIVMLSAVAYVGLGFLFGSLLAGRTEEVNGVVAGVGVPLLVLGGTFFPTEILPNALLMVARLDPVYHMNVALKSLARGEAASEPLWLNLAFLAGFALLTVASSAWAYRRMLRSEALA